MWTSGSNTNSQKRLLPDAGSIAHLIDCNISRNHVERAYIEDNVEYFAILGSMPKESTLTQIGVLVRRS